MPAIDIPDPLPPAITPPRTVIEFLIGQDLVGYGGACLVARTCHWVLHGSGPEPVSRMDWSQFDGDGPPSAATLPAESTAMSRRCTRTPRGLSSMRPGSPAGCAPPFPEMKYRCGSSPGTPRPRGPVRTTTVDEPGLRATVRSGRLGEDTCSRTCLGVPR